MRQFTLTNCALASFLFSFLFCASLTTSPADQKQSNYTVYLTGNVFDKDGKPFSRAILQIAKNVLSKL